MSTKSIILYVLIAAMGIGVGILGTLLINPAPANSGHSEDDGHNHEAALAVASADGNAESSAWCDEHRVPESQCTKCHPELVTKFKESGDWCAEHAIPESHCRLCNPDLKFAQEPLIAEQAETYSRPDVYFPPNAKRCETDRAIIQFANAETVERAGLTLQPAIGSETTGSLLEMPAEIIFDETRAQALTLAIPGTVVKWAREAGEAVTAPSAICEMESPEMAELQSSYLALLTEARVDRQNSIRAESLYQAQLMSAAEYDAIRGETAITVARLKGVMGQLQAAGMSGDQIDEIETKGISSRWILHAGLNGSLLERRAVMGVLLEPGSTVAVVGDAKALWIQGHIRERDAERVAIGQRVEFTMDAAALDRVAGEVIWVAQYVDPETRTVSIRAKLLDSIGLPRANRYGRMLVSSQGATPAVMVPKDAVQWEGCCNVVFVAVGGNKFSPRKVAVERGDRARYRVSSGLNEGEIVVVGGSYLLKTELMKGSMGSGCCGLEPEL
jgi:cobalt-zinc-cadmium efflux system membrane fusion protein